MLKKIPKLTALISLVLTVTVTVFADVPSLVNYQGSLTNAGGIVVADGNYSVTFRLYDVPVGGSPLWLETHTVATSSGLFSAILGTFTPLGVTEFASSGRYLGIQVGTDPELSPRSRFVSVPYALNAQSAAGWEKSDSSVILQNPTDNLGLGTALPRARIEAVTLDTTAGLFLSAAASTATKVIHAKYTGTGTYNAIAVYGESIPTVDFGIGGFFKGGNTGIHGEVVQPGDDVYTAVDGYAAGDGTGAKYGMHGRAVGADGYKLGVMGEATGVSGQKFGIWGYADGNAPNFAYGVYGEAYGQGANGVTAHADGVDADGLVARATGGGLNFGVRSSAYGSGINYGIYAEAYNGTTNFAGVFDGDVDVAGTLSKVAGSFKIDHPLDPENKYLQHSFVESPDMKNVYDGNAVLGAGGSAVITLPDYFEALNKDFRYQLTCIGGYAPVYIAQKISGNSFRIAGGTAGLEVSWQVTGIRKDPYANAHRIQEVVDKPSQERGKYQFPELYGKPESAGIGYESRNEMESRRASHPEPSLMERK